MRFLNKKTLIISLTILIVFLVFLAIKPKEVSPSVLKTIPENDSEYVLENSQIDIEFDYKTTDKNKKNITFKVTPEIEYDSTWITNTYKIIPKSNLENSKTYTIQVFYKEKEIFSFSFQTEIFSQESIKKYGLLQTEDDILYGNALKKTVEDYPWYPSLPIRTKEFVVYYDFKLNKFAITFLSPIKDKDQEDILTNKALDSVKKIGVKEPVPYYTRTSE